MLGFSRYEWLPAEVPGHVHSDLVRNGVIADPFVDLREIGSQWVDAEEWVYRAQFPFRPNPDLPRRVLRFEGLDTVCAISVNGVSVATHDNMFTPLELDVSELLDAGINSVEVQFESALRVGADRRRAYFEKEGLQSDLVRFDERAFVRKAPYMFGWDWGPRLVSAGIWKPVRLLEFTARITDVRITQLHLPDGAVSVACCAELEGAGAAVHYLCLKGKRPVRLLDGEPYHIANPELWWPRGMGEQVLHDVVTLLLPGQQAVDGQSLEAVSQRALDRRETRVGFRRVELKRAADRFGEEFRFEVNGRRLWCLGANWIPDHSFPSSVTRSSLEAQLRRAADMNMNMLRIWGGGVYESDDFYDVCDQLGILVWQDFPFACSYAPDDEAAQAVMRVEASVNVRRLRNHPSLALWCGNNENLVMFENKWDDPTKHPPRYHGGIIWDVTLPGVLAELDSQRPYLPTSPQGGANANADECGDQHNWDVWHGRGDWTCYSDSRARFPSEYGFASAPSRAAWLRAFSDPQAYELSRSDHPVARWHDKTKKGHATFVAFVELHYPPALDLPAWTYTSQLNQRDALRHAIEHYRRSEFAAGSLVWQLNDCWPVQSWSVVDSEGVYKAAAYELRRLHAPLMAAVEVAGITSGVCEGNACARIWAVYDNGETIARDDLLVELRDSMTGKVVGEWREPVTLNAAQRRCVVEVALTDVPLERTLLWVSFGGYDSVRPLCEPKALQVRSLKWQARQRPDELELASDGPVLDALVEVFLAGGGMTSRFFDLREAGTFTLHGISDAQRVTISTLAGRHELPVQPC